MLRTCLLLLSTVAYLPSQTARQNAWKLLEAGVHNSSAEQRRDALTALSVLRANTTAISWAEAALHDGNPEVRAMGAAALGEMHARKSVPQLRRALADTDPKVALTAANALHSMHDSSAYAFYYSVLTGERKAKRGLISSSLADMKNPRKMSELGVSEGLGFIPYAGLGLTAFRTLTKDDASPVRASAALALSRDPDPNTRKALADATADKSWMVRSAALQAIARSDDRKMLPAIETALTDPKTQVRFAAAAAIIRLSGISAKTKN